jgi:hypothetical protein
LKFRVVFDYSQAIPAHFSESLVSTCNSAGTFCENVANPDFDTLEKKTI